MKTINRMQFGVLRVAATVGVLVAALSPALGQFAYARLRTFGFADLIGTYPGGLTEGTNGALYGLAYGGGEAELGTVFQLNKDGSGFTNLYSFSGTNGDGSSPGGGLVLASNGSFYGTTSSGGYSNLGTVFRIDQDGSHYAVLKSFGEAGDGAAPVCGLIQATNGALYGTTLQGGDHGLGTVFSINTDGSGYLLLKSFIGSGGDGAQPRGALVQGADGRLYGTTALGGSNNLGTVFTLDLAGGGYQVLRSFTGALGDGSQPDAALAPGSDGALYGTTSSGGVANQGTVFRINPDGTGYSVIHKFAAAAGANPDAPLIFGTNGVLYGTTFGGGAGSNGTVFRINPDGSGFMVLKSYQAGGEDGAQPEGALMQGSDGALYGTTISGGSMGSLGTAFRLDLAGAVYTVIHNFLMTGGDGCNPQDALLVATNGCLYGTTQNGGTYDQGAIFKMNTDGSGYSVVHSFAGTNGPGLLSDGALPSAGLIQGTDGALYGTTPFDYEVQVSGQQQGSSYTLAAGNGTIFKLNPDGSNYRVLKNFTGGAYGYGPSGALVQATNGLLYGTTGAGSLFSINLDGSGYAVLKNVGPAALVQGSDGRLYGTTPSGATSPGGTLIALNLDGSGFQVLRALAGQDGTSPWAALIQGRDGALYGTATSGGKYGKGTVFKLHADGTGFAVLQDFTGLNGDGSSPSGALLQAADGLLYGTTSGGGAHPLGFGTVFRLNTNGTGYAVLRSFIQNFYDGILPMAGLVQTSDGTLYGTTSNGGRDQNGTIYCLTPQPVMSPPAAAANGCRLGLAGPAGRTYTIERSSSISGPWIGIGRTTLGLTGAGEFVDGSPPAGAAFYRAACP
jgi:uncharacterized repeat protein (TIGR03803 family)